MNRARILILGAGPTGLEAGPDSRILQMAHGPAGNLRSWGHVRTFMPWSIASLGSRATLEAT